MSIQNYRIYNIMLLNYDIICKLTIFVYAISLLMCKFLHLIV